MQNSQRLKLPERKMTAKTALNVPEKREREKKKSLNMLMKDTMLNSKIFKMLLKATTFGVEVLERPTHQILQ